MFFCKNKNFNLSLLMGFFLVMSASFSQAAPSLQPSLNFVNKTKSLDEMAEPLRHIFITEEDNRQINKVVNSLQPKVDKWLWRMEARGNNTVAMRINGGFQVTVEQLDVQKGSFVVNGTKLSMLDVKSFLSFKNSFEEALKKKQASLDSLFIEEAQALTGLEMLAIFGIGSAVAHGSSGGNTANKQIYNHGQRCNTDSKRKRLRDTRSKWRAYYSPNVGGAGTAIDAQCWGSFGKDLGKVSLCKCVSRKQRNCSIGGYNFTYNYAMQFCAEAESGKTPSRRTYRQPKPQYSDPTTPCHKDKYGKWSGNCKKPVYKQPKYKDPTTPCHKDKYGKWSGNCNYQKPEEPNYNQPNNQQPRYDDSRSSN